MLTPKLLLPLVVLVVGSAAMAVKIMLGRPPKREDPYADVQWDPYVYSYASRG